MTHTPKEDYMSGWNQAIRCDGQKPVNFNSLGKRWCQGWEHGYHALNYAKKIASGLPDLPKDHLLN